MASPEGGEAMGTIEPETGYNVNTTAGWVHPALQVSKIIVP